MVTYEKNCTVVKNRHSTFVLPLFHDCDKHETNLISMARSQHHEYDPIGQSFEAKDEVVPTSIPDFENESFLYLREPTRLSNLSWIFPWILCAVFATTSGILMVLFLRQTTRVNSQCQYENDFSMFNLKPENYNTYH